MLHNRIKWKEDVQRTRSDMILDALCAQINNYMNKYNFQLKYDTFRKASQKMERQIYKDHDHDQSLKNTNAHLHKRN